MLHRYFGIDESQGDIRTDLAVDPVADIWLGAGYLKMLQEDYACKYGETLSDRSTAIAYEFGEGQFDLLRRTGFSGREARRRGAAYDRTEQKIVREWTS